MTKTCGTTVAYAIQPARKRAAAAVPWLLLVAELLGTLRAGRAGGAMHRRMVKLCLPWALQLSGGLCLPITIQFV